MNRYLLCLICIIYAIALSTQSVTQAQETDELFIFAASSLTDVFTDLANNFEVTSSNTQVVLNFAGSSTLSAQILQGASADIFASANLEQLQNVIDDRLIDENDTHIFATNELVLITPESNPANIQSARDLENDDVLLVLAAPSVPIREYTNILIDNLSYSYNDSFGQNVLNNVVSEEGNVRQIVARIVLDEADAGIVYRTDITPDIAERIEIIEFPPNTSPPAVYPIAPLLNSTNSELADEFIAYILSDEGQDILSSWGFCPPDNDLESSEETPEPTITPEMTQEANASC